jgi:hypothetical protein
MHDTGIRLVKSFTRDFCAGGAKPEPLRKGYTLSVVMVVSKHQLRFGLRRRRFVRTAPANVHKR